MMVRVISGGRIVASSAVTLPGKPPIRYPIIIEELAAITLTIISFFYDAFASNPYVRMFLKGMQCGVTAILIKVVLDLVVKQVKKKLALPLLVMAGTFIASVVFKINIMQIIAVDAIIGLLLMRDPQYD